jgi:hypothetical protein
MDGSTSMESVNEEENAIPYHCNLELEQVFEACHAYITAIRKSTKVETILSHLDGVDETLQWATQFTSNEDIPQPCSFLLIVILQQIYEHLRRYVDSQNVSLEFSRASAVPHGQVHVSLEKLAEHIEIQVDEAEMIEEYGFHIQREVHQATESSSVLEKVVVAVEIWTNQLAALTLYCYPRYIDGVKDSVQMALEDIRRLFDTKTIE